MTTNSCVVLWSTWLARNENIFQSSRFTKATLQYDIQNRSSWTVANNWLDSIQLNEWVLNPHEKNLRHEYRVQLQFWKRNCTNTNFITSIEGSWCTKIGKGGIDGKIKDIHKSTHFTFSGSYIYSVSFDAQIVAFLLVILWERSILLLMLGWSSAWIRNN